MRKRGNNIVPIFIGLIILLGIGYAYLNSGLSINGTTNISNASWNVYWDSLNVTSGSVEDVTTAAHILTGETEVEFNVNFTKPGDFYEFTVDAVNDGSIDAMVDSLTKGVYATNGTTPKTLPDYLTYFVTYSDGVEIESNHLLSAGHTETYKVRVEYKTDIEANQLPSTADNYMFKIAVNYKQADDNAISKPIPSFANDSWDMIISLIRSGNTSAYHVGDTKTVDMGTFGIHTLRIANKTTPNECGATGFSQTACGFVLEFADIITTHRMNPYTGGTLNGDGSKGGWEYSEMRSYINTDIYNALPTTLKNAIINTLVVSSHGPDDSNNFITIDKLYLLAVHEVFNGPDNDNPMKYSDTAYNSTRQLNYYEELNVTNSNYSGTIKQNNGTNTWWWLRSAASYQYSNYFSCVYSSGEWTNEDANVIMGVSPAFRIG